MIKRLYRPAVILTAALALLMPVGSAHAAPVSAGPGAFVEASDDAPNRDDEKSYWNRVSFTVAEDGTFSAKTRANLTNKGGAGMITVTTYDITLNGTYDAAAGTFSGTFRIGREWNATKPKTTFEQEGTGSYSGTFGGSASSENEITLTFDGTNAYKSTTTFQNGKVEEDDNAYELRHVVRFPVSGDLPAAKQEVRDSGARFSDIAGQVEVLIPTGYDDRGDPTYDEEAWTFAKLDMVLPVGAKIKTDRDSGVVLSFADMGTFQMKPDSEIILTDPRLKDSQFQILAGSLWANVKKLAAGQSIDFEGSQAVCGIKGTTLVIEETGAKTTLKVLEGSVEFAPKAGAAPMLVDIGATISADAGGPSEMTPFDVAAEQASWDEPKEGDLAGGSGESGGVPSMPILAGVGVAVVLLGVVAFLLVRRGRGNS